MMNFEFARTHGLFHPSIRQKFVDSIDLGEAKPYVERVVYKPGLHPICADIMMACQAHPLSYLNMKHLKSTISVYSPAFMFLPEECLFIANEGDFLSTLIDHEGHHAYQNFSDPRRYLPGFREIVNLVGASLSNRYRAKIFDRSNMIEFEAYNHQLEQMQKRDVSHSFREQIEKRVASLDSKIKQIQPSSTGFPVIL